jgi:hypothetical protein
MSGIDLIGIGINGPLPPIFLFMEPRIKPIIEFAELVPFFTLSAGNLSATETFPPLFLPTRVRISEKLHCLLKEGCPYH